MKIPIDRKLGLRFAILRVVSVVRRLLWTSVGVPAPRPRPSRIELLPPPTFGHRK